MVDDDAAYVAEVEAFRRAKDVFFGQDLSSPLTGDQRASFAGLAYFPVDLRLRFEGPIIPDAHHGGPPIEMLTTGNEVRQFTRVGAFAFVVDGHQAQIYLYSSGRGRSLFVPFRDATSGVESYGAGRYLDLELEPDGSLIVDFNLAYSPSCAYNAGWVCPLPPVENHLIVAVRAGERSFADARH